MLIALLLAAADPAASFRPIDLRLDACAGPECGGPRRSRYRLDPQVDDGADRKRVALAQDGTKCDVVGARLCTSKPQTLYRTHLTE